MDKNFNLADPLAAAAGVYCDHACSPTASVPSATGWRLAAPGLLAGKYGGFYPGHYPGKLAEHPLGSSFGWLPAGDTLLKIGVTVDPLAAVTLFFVAWTVLMIFIYSRWIPQLRPTGWAARPARSASARRRGV